MWNVERYARFAAQRLQPSKDLAARLTQGAKTVLDVGCGSGLSTRAVLDRFPNAAVTGVDLSREMLERAEKDVPGVQWIRRDCSKPMGDLGRYDVVFSNAFLQWLTDQEAFLGNIRANIAEGGCLAVQVPDMNSLKVMACIEETAEEINPDHTLFHGVRGCRGVPMEAYYDMLRKYYRDVEIWRTEYVHVFDSADSVVEFVRGTALNPYMERLTGDGQAEFLRILGEKARVTYPRRANGDVLFPFPRIFFTVKV